MLYKLTYIVMMSFYFLTHCANNFINCLVRYTQGVTQSNITSSQGFHECRLSNKEYTCQQVVVTHTFNLSTWEAETGGSLSSRPACSTEEVPGQPWLYTKRNPVVNAAPKCTVSTSRSFKRTKPPFLHLHSRR